MSRRSWVVAEGDGRTVGDIVARAGADPRVIAEGRVFLGKIRVKRADEKVVAGDRIEISSDSKSGASVEILFRGEGLVVIDKPAGISTIPDQGSSSDTAIALAAKATNGKVTDLHPTSRLDREVSGVLIFARTKQAADALLAARAQGGYVRRYVAIAEGSPEADSGVWDAAIGRARDPKLRAPFAPGETKHDAKPSRTAYRVVARAGKFVLLACAPETGRTHQIRVHASHARLPLLGDRAYGGATRVALASGKILSADRIYLHCARVSIEKAGKLRDFVAPIPDALIALWTALGGDATAWDTALACDVPSSSSAP